MKTKREHIKELSDVIKDMISYIERSPKEAHIPV